MEKSLEQFQQNLKQLRTRRGFTQEELSAACGFSSSYLGKIERGGKHPSLTTLFRIAEVLQVPPARLLRIKESPTGQPEESSRSPSLAGRSRP